MTSEFLINALRSEAQAIKNTQGTSSVCLIFTLSSGATKTVMLNPDGSWRAKPTDSSGIIRFEWLDTSHGNSEISGSLYTIQEAVRVEYIDPTTVLGCTFSYDKTTTTTIKVETEE